LPQNEAQRKNVIHPSRSSFASKINAAEPDDRHAQISKTVWITVGEYNGKYPEVKRTTPGAAAKGRVDAGLDVGPVHQRPMLRMPRSDELAAA
jgi:hypothetical protein